MAHFVWGMFSGVFRVYDGVGVGNLCACIRGSILLIIICEPEYNTNPQTQRGNYPCHFPLYTLLGMLRFLV